MAQRCPGALIDPTFHASLLPKHRRMTLQGAIAAGATHALCLDDDMVFPADTAERLAQHGLPFVGVNYQTKKGTPSAITADEEHISSKGKTGIEQVGYIGFGVVFIDLEYLQKVPLPWFGVPWVPSRQSEIGEDYVFCLQWREAGFPIYVDHDLSQEVQHVTDGYLQVK